MNTRLRGLAGRVPTDRATGVAIAVIVVVIAASLVARPAPPPGPSASPGRTGPVAVASPTHGPTSAPQPTPTEEPWDDFVLGPAIVTAAFAPVVEDRAGVATTTRFTLRSFGDTPAITLAAGMQAEPPIDFRVLKGATAAEAILEPRAALLEGQTYRFRLTTPDGSLGGSWAFRTQAPLRIVGTLPADESSAVPVDTGIEITFDQDGTTEFEPHFRIEPAVAGRFEQHDRTWAFVPGAPLKPATAYRVTIDPGVEQTGSDQVLESGVSFRFETEAVVSTPEMRVDFAGPMAAIRPGERPALPLYSDFDDEREQSPPATLPVRIYRLPGRAAAVTAAERLTGPDSWLRASGGGLVPVDDLERVARLDAPLIVDREYTAILSIPVRLDAGAYLVVVPRRARTAQLLLQVRDLSVYAVSTETDSVAWVNDLDSVTPVAGATVALADGRKLGTTDADGVARFATPDELRPDADEDWNPRARIVSVTAPDGRWIVAGLGISISWLDGRNDNNASFAAEPSNRWWLLLNTDRTEFRQTDTIHAWGLVRSRDGDSPGEVEVRLHAVDFDEEADVRVPIARVPVTLSRRGVFAADIPVQGLPRATYSVDLFVDGQLAGSRWISVADIRKPSYRLDVETDRHAFVDGEQISVTIRASFFDGSTVPAIDLRVSSDESETSTTVTTDATGTARLMLPANFDYDTPSGFSSQSINVAPARPEEGEISGGAGVIVFPSKAWLESDARLTGTTLVVKGQLSRVDFAAVEASYAAGSWDWPYGDVISGTALGGKEVSATVVQQREVRGKVHTDYDYLEKRVVTWYEWDTVETTVGTFRGQTAADGTFRMTVTVPVATDDYSITVRAADAAGRPVIESAYASPPVDPVNFGRPSYLIAGNSCGFVDSITVGLDDQASLTMHDGDGSVADEGRFLFLVASRGLREVVAGQGATYRRTLRDADLPGFSVRAVQVTGKGYAAADAAVDVDEADLAVTVRLVPDRARYGPGDRVRVQVTTLGPDGRPVAADVVVQGVDEKLFAIGAAREADVLRELHARTRTGYLQSFASHRIPMRVPDGGCGGTGGGREAFGDVVTFQLVRTGADGRATVAFDLLDDLTSWHVTGMAITDGLRAGSASVLIPVSLPFFVESVLAPEYLVGDVPVLRVRGYGDALRAGDPVRFTVSAPSLGLADVTVDGRAFEAVRVPLPAMTAGEHRIRVAGTGPGSGLDDAVIRVVRVIPSRLAGLVTRYDLLTPAYVPEGGDGLTSYTVVDAGRGSLISVLIELATARSARFDKLAAADVARQLLIDEFGFAPASLPTTGFDPARHEQGGITLLPYSSTDPELSALAAVIIPDRVRVDSLREYLRVLPEEDSPTRETRILALAGLAGLGDDVLAELRVLATEGLTIRESLWLGIGLAAAGDENGARTIERELLEAHGERFGPWARLAVGGSVEDTLDAARLLLVLSSRLGEPFARDVERYLVDHPSREHAIALEQLAYVQASLERLDRSPGRFAWTVAGERHEVELEPGDAVTLVLTAPQRATLQLERLDGELAIVSSWTGTSADLPQSASASITRRVTPAGNAPDDRLVRVTIEVTFGTLATGGCWQITDLAPSGLVPLQRSYGWPEDDGLSGIVGPYEIDGQRVAWCVSPSDRNRTFGYAARVVSPGTYTWEPAIIQSVNAPELGSATEGFTFTIR